MCDVEKLTSPCRRFVAVKVGLGSDIPLPDRETEILSQLCKTGTGKRGYQRVIELLDVFIVEGPNGFHQCLVTEVISPLSDPDAMQHCSFDVVRQIVEGFAFLHGEGIVHGGRAGSVVYTDDGQAADVHAQIPISPILGLPSRSWSSSRKTTSPIILPTQKSFQWFHAIQHSH